MAKTCAIMQPTYLPWSGYFNLMASADTFIFLDDVQFQRKSWHSRNRIVFNRQPRYIEVPVKKQPLTEKIESIEISYQKDWVTAHKKMLQEAYRKAPYADAILPELFTLLEKRPVLLVDLNIDICLLIADRLGLLTRFFRASELQSVGVRSAHVANLCKAVGADTYRSPAGAKDYLLEDDFQSKYGLTAQLQSFDPASYPQKSADEFLSHLSVVDVIANLGWDKTAEYISPVAGTWITL